MSVNNNNSSPSGSAGQAGGEPKDDPNNKPGNEGDNPNPDNPEGDKSGDKKTVSYDSYHKAVSAEKSAKEKLRAAEERLSALESANREREEKELEKNQEWQKLYENAKARASELEEKLNKRDELDTRGRKVDAVLRALGANVKDDYLGLVETCCADVAINPETGEIDAASVESAKRLVESKYPEIIQRGSGVGAPNDAPKTGSARGLSADEYRALPLAEKKKRARERAETFKRERGLT